MELISIKAAGGWKFNYDSVWCYHFVFDLNFEWCGFWYFVVILVLGSPVKIGIMFNKYPFETHGLLEEYLTCNQVYIPLRPCRLLEKYLMSTPLRLMDYRGITPATKPLWDHVLFLNTLIGGVGCCSVGCYSVAISCDGWVLVCWLHSREGVRL